MRGEPQYIAQYRWGKGGGGGKVKKIKFTDPSLLAQELVND